MPFWVKNQQTVFLDLDVLAFLSDWALKRTLGERYKQTIKAPRELPHTNCGILNAAHTVFHNWAEGVER